MLNTITKFLLIFVVCCTQLHAENLQHMSETLIITGIPADAIIFKNNTRNTITIIGTDDTNTLRYIETLSVGFCGHALSFDDAAPLSYSILTEEGSIPLNVATYLTAGIVTLTIKQNLAGGFSIQQVSNWAHHIPLAAD